MHGCRQHGETRPCILCVPLSTLPNWERELATWAPHLNTIVMHGTQAARDNAAKWEMYEPAKGQAAGRGRVSGRGGDLQVGFWALQGRADCLMASFSEHSDVGAWQLQLPELSPAGVLQGTPLAARVVVHTCSCPPRKVCLCWPTCLPACMTFSCRCAPTAACAQGRVRFHVLLTTYECTMSELTELRRIAWAALVVDEGHRLRNRHSKNFQARFCGLSFAHGCSSCCICTADRAHCTTGTERALQIQHVGRTIHPLPCMQALKSLDVAHRVLLTGTPLQNNMAELFMLMHFLDAAKFDDPEAYEAQFATLDQGDQVHDADSFVSTLCKAVASVLSCVAWMHASCCCEQQGVRQAARHSSSYTQLASAQPLLLHQSGLLGLLLHQCKHLACGHTTRAHRCQRACRWPSCTSCWRPTCCGG